MNAHYDRESLDLFIEELERDGFVRTEDVPFPLWRGEIHPAFDGLTDAENMFVGIRDGWPFMSPVLFVQGLATHHLTQGGYVCMWRDDDPNLHQWLTPERFYRRIEEWRARTKSGWIDDAGLQDDAYLNFQCGVDRVAAFDWKALRISAGAWGEAHGIEDAKTRRIDISPGRRPNRVKVLWFHAGSLDGRHPPRSLSEVEGYLPKSQQKRLRRALDSRENPQPQ